MSCSGDHHIFPISGYNKWHIVDLSNMTHIISFNKSTLEKIEVTIMNRQSRDIATLGTQDKKKEDKQITKTKHRKQKWWAILSRQKSEGEPRCSRWVSRVCFSYDTRHWRHDVSSIGTIFTIVWSWPSKEHSPKYDFNPLNFSEGEDCNMKKLTVMTKLN